MRFLFLISFLFISKLLIGQTPTADVVATPPPLPPPSHPEIGLRLSEKMPLLLVDACMSRPDNEQKECVDSFIVDYIYSNRRWPVSSSCMGIEGLVVIGWDVTTEGTAENIHIARSVHEAYDQESLRVVKELLVLYPWRPGMQYGKVVQVRYNMPVRWRQED